MVKKPIVFFTSIFLCPSCLLPQATLASRIWLLFALFIHVVPNLSGWIPLRPGHSRQSGIKVQTSIETIRVHLILFKTNSSASTRLRSGHLRRLSQIGDRSKPAPATMILRDDQSTTGLERAEYAWKRFSRHPNHRRKESWVLLVRRPECSTSRRIHRWGSLSGPASAKARSLTFMKDV